MSRRKFAVPETCIVAQGPKIQHFNNEAARRRAGGEMKNAPPRDLHIVHTLRGVSARNANCLRAARKRRGEIVVTQQDLATRIQQGLARALGFG